MAAKTLEGLGSPSYVSSRVPDYTITRSGTTYTATRPNGTVASQATDGATSGLKTVIDAVKANNVWLHFPADTYSFIVDAAGVQDHCTFNGIDGMTFSGDGKGLTTISNTSSAAQDTEPLSFTSCDFVTVRDMTVNAGGTERSTSDALDFDDGNDCVVERVAITQSRARGIVFDGKDVGASALRNVVRDCDVTVTLGTSSSGNGIELLAAEDCLIVGCVVAGCAGDGIKIGKSSPSAGRPNAKANGNMVLNCTVTNSGANGVRILSSDDNLVSGCTVRNSSIATGSHDGIRIATADTVTADTNTIDGNTCTDDQGTKTQRYGVNVSPTLSAEANDNVVTNNSLSGNLLGNLNDTGTGTIKTGNT